MIHTFVMLFEMNQLSDQNATRVAQLQRDLSAFLDLPAPLKDTVAVSVIRKISMTSNCSIPSAEASFRDVKCEALCMGNINESEAQQVAEVLKSHFLDMSPAVRDVLVPTFRSMRLPTKTEADIIFGRPINRTIPIS